MLAKGPFWSSRVRTCSHGTAPAGGGTLMFMDRSFASALGFRPRTIAGIERLSPGARARWRSWRQQLPQRKNDEPRAEIAGRRHAEGAIERVDAISDPERDARHHEHDGCGRDHAHLFGRQVDAERERADEE